MGEVYTVRGGIYDVDALAPSHVAALYATELMAAGFRATESPVVTVRPTQVQLEQDGAFKRIRLTAPPFDPIEQSRDTRVPFADDPMRLAEAGRGVLTTFAWNLCGPSDGAGALRDLLRRRRVVGWLKLSPIVTTFGAAPVQLAGYPPRPPMPGCAPRPSSSSSSSGAAGALGLLGLLGLLGFGLSRRRRA